MTECPSALDRGGDTVGTVVRKRGTCVAHGTTAYVTVYTHGHVDIHTYDMWYVTNKFIHTYRHTHIYIASRPFICIIYTYYIDTTILDKCHTGMKIDEKFRV